MSGQENELVFDNLTVAGNEIQEFGKTLRVSKPSGHFVATNAAGPLRNVRDLEEVRKLGFTSGETLRAAFVK